MQVQRGPEPPEAGDTLVLAYDDGTSWVTAYTVDGNGLTDPGFGAHAGVVVDPGALRAGLRWRLTTTGFGVGFDDYYIDDLSIQCP